MAKEIWKSIIGYEDRYEVSSLGRIRSLPSKSRSKGVMLKPNPKKSGYLNILLCKEGKVKTFRIHRLVAEAFLPNPHNLPHVNHINGIKTDNRVVNLEWCSPQYNSLHSYRVLGRKSNGGVARKKVFCLEQNRIYDSLHEASRKTGIARASITYSILRGNATHSLHWSYSSE